MVENRTSYYQNMFNSFIESMLAADFQTTLWAWFTADAKRYLQYQLIFSYLPTVYLLHLLITEEMNSEKNKRKMELLQRK